MTDVILTNREREKLVLVGLADCTKRNFEGAKKEVKDANLA